MGDPRISGGSAATPELGQRSTPALAIIRVSSEKKKVLIFASGYDASQATIYGSVKDATTVVDTGGARNVCALPDSTLIGFSGRLVCLYSKQTYKDSQLKTIIRVIVPLLVAAIAFGNTALAQLADLPETPKFVRDTHLIENGEFTRPHQPTHHATRDGRVALNISGLSRMLFRVFKPEMLDEPFTTSAPGVDNLLGSEDFVLSSTLFQDPAVQGVRGIRYVGLCEPPAEETASGKSNPRVCNVDDDCYDFTVVAAGQTLEGGITFVGTKTTVRVENPKTVNARIAEITTEEPQVGAHHPTLRDFFELMIPADGRIIIGRVAGSDIEWTDSGGDPRETIVDNVYLVNDNPDSFDSCDVRQFDKIYPLANAPYDDTISNRYGFAMHPFRDASGTVFPDDKVIGSYPWIDREANNISMTTLPGYLFDRQSGEARIPARCPQEVVDSFGGCLPDLESDINSARLQGRVMMGLWTQGKMVQFDNVVNNMDFGLGVRDKRHREVQLYSSSSEHDGWVRVAGGRGGSADAGPVPRAIDNANHFDSLEHRLYMFENLKPVSPSDVPWIVSKGVVTDELSFDDYNNPDGFIVSTMVLASRLHVAWNYFQFLYQPGDSAISNDATALPERLKIPKLGRVHNGRVELVANGGVEGRGLWLDGSDAYVEYEIPANLRNVNSMPWNISMFFDRRYSDAARNLITFSDGSSLRVTGEGHFQFVASNDIVVKEMNVPEVVQNRQRAGGEKGWAHIGINVKPGNREFTVYYNGFYLDAFTASDSMFSMGEGSLYLGAAPVASVDGFRGWIDDFKVFAQNVNQEVACNLANGTLIGINDGVGGWENIARAYPAGHHTIRQLVQAAAEETSDFYACRHDYTGDYVLHMGNIEPQYKSVREAINFPEGPLKFNEPRPDSSNNAFCLSCHTPQGKGGFGLDALTINNSLMVQDDPRRQPTQPDAKVFGFIPANWFGAGKPASAMDAGDDGLAIDQWLLGDDVQPFDPNAAAVVVVEMTEPEEAVMEFFEETEDEVVPVPVEEIVGIGAEEEVETPTEEVVEAPTEEVVEAPTEEVVEAPTEEVAEAPTVVVDTDTDAQGTEAPENSTDENSTDANIVTETPTTDDSLVGEQGNTPGADTSDNSSQGPILKTGVGSFDKTLLLILLVSYRKLLWLRRRHTTC